MHRSSKESLKASCSVPLTRPFVYDPTDLSTTFSPHA